MKEMYKKPHCLAIQLAGPPLMLNGANSVNDYKKGGDITVGDEEEKEPTLKRSIWNSMGTILYRKSHIWGD